MVISSSGKAYEIYVMNAEGSEQTRLSNDTDNQSSLSWFRRETRIAFDSNLDPPNLGMKSLS